MSNNAKTETAHQPQTLIAAMIEALGAPMAAARGNGSADGASRTLALLLDHWRTQLAAASPAAVAPAPLVIALTAIFALCDVRMVDAEPHSGIHISGRASAAFDAALRLVHLYDRICGSRVGEETMAALLGGFVTAPPDAAPPSDRRH